MASLQYLLEVVDQSLIEVREDMVYTRTSLKAVCAGVPERRGKDDGDEITETQHRPLVRKYHYEIGPSLLEQELVTLTVNILD